MFNAGGEMRLPRCHGIQWFAGLCLLQQIGQCQPTEAHATPGQHTAATDDDGRLVGINEGNRNGCGHDGPLFSQ